MSPDQRALGKRPPTRILEKGCREFAFFQAGAVLSRKSFSPLNGGSGRGRGRGGLRPFREKEERRECPSDNRAKPQEPGGLRGLAK